MISIAAQRLAAVAIALFALGPASAFADYDSCMKWCTKEHSFSHCNLLCGLAGGGKKADDKATGTVPKPDKPCGLTQEEQVDLIFVFLEEHYGPSFLIANADENDLPTSFKLKFFPYYPKKRECKGEVKISTDCSTITDLDGNDLSYAGLREQTLPCE